MGWVEEKFLDKIAIGKLTQPLWDGLRDSIGMAVMEFQHAVPSSHLARKDCTSRGNFCIRIEKPNGTSLEVYLDSQSHSVKTGQGPEEVLICSYRLNKDRSSLEFYREGNPESEPLELFTAEKVSQMALEKYLFDPFPAVILKPVLIA